MNLTPPGAIVLVDDDPVVLSATQQSLELAGLAVHAFHAASDALRIINPDFNGAVITDMRMPELDGLQFFGRIQAIDPTIPVTFITGHGDVAMAVSAMQDGAHDFITKPFSSSHLAASAQRALERRQLELDNRLLRGQLENRLDEQSPLIGQSAPILRLHETIAQISGADVNVLIEGESGVGKELVALMLHRHGKRRSRRFVNVDCSALRASGSFHSLIGEFDSMGRKTGPGLIEAANLGTLFLDDIEKLDFSAQSVVLDAIEERQVRATPQSEPIPVDIKVIATSRSDLSAALNAGIIREDLFYALNVVKIRIPALRDRRADIPLLFAHFLEEASRQLHRDPPRMTDAVRRRLINYDWPGNVRELRGFAFQSLVGIEGAQETVNDADQTSLAERVEQFEAHTIRTTLATCQGNAAAAMQLLSLPRKTFYDKLKRHRIDIDEFRRSAARPEISG